MSNSWLRLLLRITANAATISPIATIPTIEKVAATAPVLDRKPFELVSGLLEALSVVIAAAVPVAPFDVEMAPAILVAIRVVPAAEGVLIDEDDEDVEIVEVDLKEKGISYDYIHQ